MFHSAEDIRFREKHELFMNADHLNEEGAKMFTIILLKETGEGEL